ncbi:MAG: mannose-1-phosphate guanylyltransferase [Fibrobacterota bacterium]|nr:mannose-1-phosphate guanylyltransferase [Chitinispirillaceae bacterium]
MKVVPVILAGGIGERFWPLSRSSMPKQLLKLVSSKTMAEETLARVASFCTKGVKPLIITNKTIAASMKKLLPKKWVYDMIVEPVGKNTAPPVALAASWIEKKYGESVMVVLSADHDIRPKEEFTAALKFAVSLAEKTQNLIVFGVKPSRPDTGYGYLKLGKKLDEKTGICGYTVKEFVEKPNEKNAKKYVASGNYMWNSGMFVWTTKVILEEFESYMPDLYKLVKKAENSKFSSKAIDDFYLTCQKESIDFGIMEHSKRVSATVGNFGWDDIGSWESIPRLNGTNDDITTVSGDLIYCKGTANSILVNRSKLTVAAVGLDNVALIVTDDAILAIDRSKLPDLKKFMGEIKADKKFSPKLF